MRFWGDGYEAITKFEELSPKANQSALVSVHGLARFGRENDAIETEIGMIARDRSVSGARLCTPEAAARLADLA